MNIRMITIELEDGTIYEVPGMVPGMMVTQVEIQMDREVGRVIKTGMTMRLELRGVGSYGYREGR